MYINVLQFTYMSPMVEENNGFTASFDYMIIILFAFCICICDFVSIMARHTVAQLGVFLVG